ncbi:MAG: HAMP domain-containing protein [Nitrospirae bacterium]|nr:HAMP domain-containing protein [Nitrospirota bacterium]
MARGILWFKSRLELKLFSIIIVIIAGFAALIFLTIQKETDDLLKKTKEQASFLSSSVITSLQKDMMEGRADMARWLIEDLKTMKGVERLQIIRTDSTEAFQDLSTIRDVEKRTAIKKEWLENHPDKANPIAKGIDNPLFRDALKKGTTEAVEYNERVEGKEVFTYFKPIANEPRCFGCHGSDKNLRGILMVSIAVDKDIQSIRWYVIITSVITVLIVITFMRTLINNIILKPITHLVDVVDKISMGETDKKIDISSNDEIQDLADAINRLRTSMKMAIEKLYKR